MRSEITLSSLLVMSASEGVKLVRKDGSMPPGHNGPYHDVETPVRNTSHWLILFLKAYQISGENVYKLAAEKCLNYLLSSNVRPSQASFWHRTKKGKDSSNGVVGQAWTIEALIAAYEVFGREDVLAVALDVFNIHPYDYQSNGWKIVNIDGTIDGFDNTFNHQLWFAAVGARLMGLTKKQELSSVMDFIENFHNNIQLYPNGVIKHVPLFYLKRKFGEKLKAVAAETKRNLTNKSSELYLKSVGYHGFNLYAVAMIDDAAPNANLLRTEKIEKAIAVISTDIFKTQLTKSKYGYPYNPAGIEIAYAMQMISNNAERDRWVNDQLTHSYDFSSNLMSKGNVFDSITSAARLYEATRLDGSIVITARG